MPVKLSEHFTDAELNCHCGCGKTVESILIHKLEMLRTVLGVPLIITSGARCFEYNRSVGGKQHSLHLKGLAADISCPDSAFRYKLIHAALSQDFTGIGIGKTFIHLDLRPEFQEVCFLY